MLRVTRWGCVGLLLLGAVPAAPGQDRNDLPQEINDEAGLFGKGAVTAANRDIADIKKKYHKDVLIETREKGPPRDEYRKWAIKQAERYRTDGIYIVITRQPKHFEVLIGKQTQKRGLFTPENQRHLVKLLGTELGKSPDEALRQVVSYIHQAFRENSQVSTDGTRFAGAHKIQGAAHAPALFARRLLPCCE